MAIVIENLDRLVNKLDTIDCNEAISSVISKSCLRVVRSAKQNCPVDTGCLRRSITSEVDGLDGSVGTNVNYATYVEQGTIKQSPQPFLYPALLENKEKILKDIEKAIVGSLKNDRL